jgi:hypothetical protein
MSNTVKMIKKDAVINIQIGTGFLQNLQKLLFYIAADLTQEQLDEYKRQAEAQQDFTEDWMTHITTISVLIREIEKSAEQQGHTYDTDLESTMPQES